MLKVVNVRERNRVLMVVVEGEVMVEGGCDLQGKKKRGEKVIYIVLH